MEILLLEPFFSGSHKKWALEWQKFSAHSISLLTLPGRHWKWRMHGAAITLADHFLKQDVKPDLIVASDMLDLATFQALTRHKTAGIPFVLYMHENQLAYPWSPGDDDPQLKRDRHYMFLNYTSALAADRILFNSEYNQGSFLNTLPNFLKVFPDFQNMETVEKIRAKSTILPIGLDLNRFDQFKMEVDNKVPLILWNHRWEYDKQPELFFELLMEIKKMELSFQLAVLGEQTNKVPDIFKSVPEVFSDELVHFGYADTFEIYAKWLWKADILPVTNQQDFFGMSIAEAIHCNTYPLLPDALSYPSVLSKLNREHFYNNPADLKDRLVKFLKNPPDFRGQFAVQDYNWSSMIRVYDQKMADFVG